MSGLADVLARLPPEERREALGALEVAELQALEYHWPLWARPDQMPPSGDWRTWLLLAGRGAGKTRSASEWVRDQVETGRRRAIGIIGPTADTLRRDVVQGESGILRISPPWCMPAHEPSQRRIVWPDGAVAYLLSSEEPDRIRGVNLDGFYGDELTSWTEPEACWDNLQFALRITGPKGDAPAGVISTTPKRHKLLKSVMADPSTVVTRAKTTDNAANLDARTLSYLERRYAGTSIGRQELGGELLEDAEGALWNRAMLDATRVTRIPSELLRVVVAIDPSGGANRSNDETGIVVVALDHAADGYVLADLSGKFSPEAWARRAVFAYREFQADRIVAESNFGGGMVEATIRAVDPNVPVRMVHASRGKAVRAEPVVALYEQNRIHHVGHLLELEDQLCTWEPATASHSPDRLDALVWGFTELMVSGPRAVRWFFG